MTISNTMPAILDKLNMNQFRSWLEQHRSDDIIGYIAHPCECPLANYLADQGHQVLIGTDHITPQGDVFRHLLMPEWVVRFVHHIDDTDSGDDEITAERAIHCMKIVETEMTTRQRVDPPPKD